MSSPKKKNNPKPLFEATCNDRPKLLHVSFAENPTASLGCELVNRDTGDPKEMFLPGYAVVGRLLPGQTIAREAGVQVGDCIVAINGQGIRRFPLDYEEEEVTCINDDDEDDSEEEDSEEEDSDEDSDESDSDEEDKKKKKKKKRKSIVDLDHQVVPPGGAYDVLLAKIKHVKANSKKGAGGPPLVITFERYGWDARANAWTRFLLGRDSNVPQAMQLIQDHEAWKAVTFPIDLTSPGLQRLFKDKVISIMDVGMGKGHPPTIYVNYSKIQHMQQNNLATLNDIIHGFVVFSEMILSKLSDPRSPKTNQFIDLTNVTITSGFRVDTLKAINQVFERNYPETLNKMVMYPISSMVGLTARSLLGFVDERTQSKFIITNSVETLCDALGWKVDMLQSCGSLEGFIDKYERVDYASMLFFNAGLSPGGKNKDASAESSSSGGDGDVGGGSAGAGGVGGGGAGGGGARGVNESFDSDMVPHGVAAPDPGPVQGHIKGTGVILDRSDDDDEEDLIYKIRATHDLLKYMIATPTSSGAGSCCLVIVDSYSTPVIDVNHSEGWFCIKLDSFTKEKINLTSKELGSQVIVEVDVVRKYWEYDMKKIMKRIDGLELKVESLELQLAAEKAKNKALQKKQEKAAEEAKKAEEAKVATDEAKKTNEDKATEDKVETTEEEKPAEEEEQEETSEKKDNGSKKKSKKKKKQEKGDEEDQEAEETPPTPTSNDNGSKKKSKKKKKEAEPDNDGDSDASMQSEKL